MITSSMDMDGVHPFKLHSRGFFLRLPQQHTPLSIRSVTIDYNLLHQEDRRRKTTHIYGIQTLCDVQSSPNEKLCAIERSGKIQVNRKRMIGRGKTRTHDKFSVSSRSTKTQFDRHIFNRRKKDRVE